MTREWRSGDRCPSWDDRDAPDPNTHQHAEPHVCTVCPWHGRGVAAYWHTRETGHATRGRNWPAAWPDAIVSGGKR